MSVRATAGASFHISDPRSTLFLSEVPIPNQPDNSEPDFFPSSTPIFFSSSRKKSLSASRLVHHHHRSRLLGLLASPAAPLPHLASSILPVCPLFAGPTTPRAFGRPPFYHSHTWSERSLHHRHCSHLALQGAARLQINILRDKPPDGGRSSRRRDHRPDSSSISYKTPFSTVGIRPSS